MSLYRKYRPKTFAEVVGQEHIVTTLENSVLQDKVAHAYLFSGPRGTGKTSIARILAKMLLTRGIEDEAVQKQFIKAVEEERLTDLLEIDAASHTGVDDIRDLIEKIQFAPVAASAKVYIIDEVHMLSKGAFNALLKTLEEPPSYAYFILATTELHKVPATIQSRCQRFPFRHVREEDIIRHLQHIADQERITIDRTALRAIAHHAQGGMRDAIALLDQLRSMEKISAEDVRQRLGESGLEYVEGILAAVDANDHGKILETIRRIEDVGIPLETIARELLTVVRTGLHEAVQTGAPLERFRRSLDTLLAALRDLRTAPVPGLVLEAALLSLCEQETPQMKEKGGGFFARKKKAEAEKIPESTEPVANGTEPKPAPAPGPVVADAIVEAPDFSFDALQDSWNTILENISPASVKMSLKNGRPQDVTEKTVTVSFASSFHRDKVAASDASRRVEEVMEKIFKRHLKLRCVVEDEHASTSATHAEAVNLAEAAKEIF